MCTLWVKCVLCWLEYFGTVWVTCVPEYNLAEPEYNIADPEYNLPEPVYFTPIIIS